MVYIEEFTMKSYVAATENGGNNNNKCSYVHHLSCGCKLFLGKKYRMYLEDNERILVMCESVSTDHVCFLSIDPMQKRVRRMQVGLERLNEMITCRTCNLDANETIGK